MIDASEVARVHAEATRCRYKTGTLGVWARHWLELYEVMITLQAQLEVERDETMEREMRGDA